MNISTNLSSFHHEENVVVDLHVVALKKMVPMEVVALKLMKMNPLLLVLNHGSWEPRDQMEVASQLDHHHIGIAQKNHTKKTIS